MDWALSEEKRFERVRLISQRFVKRNPFRYFKTSPEIIRLAVMMYIRFPLSLRNVEDLLHQRAIDITPETVRFWLPCLDTMAASAKLSSFPSESS